MIKGKKDGVRYIKNNNSRKKWTLNFVLFTRFTRAEEKTTTKFIYKRRKTVLAYHRIHDILTKSFCILKI